MKKFLLVLLSFLLTACSTGGSEFQTNEQSFISGNGIVTTIEKDARKTAPLITGPMLGGGEFVGSEGKVRVMNVWASWCSPCRAEAPALQDLAKAHPEVEFVGV
ncbi:MAG: TlpA family protein disulfide reductase [Actinomycetales bacterium]